MNHRFVSLIVASLTLSAGPQSVVSAQPVRLDVAEVEVLVSGVPQRRYLHDGRWYVEALKGREYAIRMRNPYPVRVAVALSVDGLNTIDARHTAAFEGRKWVIEPFQTITISGWQVNRAEARRFEFTTEARSYGQALGQTDNLGVISAVFFKERAPAIMTRDSDDRNAQSERLARTAPQAPAAAAAQPAGSNATADATTTKLPADEEYAATGMGQRTDHAVRQVYLDLEGSPAQTVNIRYEFRPQLVRLGILPAARLVDPLQRRERSRGFEAGFSPEVP
jgi:hypothetical protein